jgi:hypothetical protein
MYRETRLKRTTWDCPNFLIKIWVLNNWERNKPKRSKTKLLDYNYLSVITMFILTEFLNIINQIHIIKAVNTYIV